jgi:3-deoxy-D-manno-octulosonate 8-phosphate phosphatase (KDO 8-P phosphatase)
MVKYLIMDVDGTLTDGKIYMGPEGEAMKAFSIKDGYVINFILKPVGIIPVIITARTSSIVQHRCDELGITEVYQGKMDKLASLNEIVGENEVGACAYFGDDILDLRCMAPIKKAGGIVGCPADAVQEIKSIADYVCVSKAGEGALREFSEWLVKPRLDQIIIDKRLDDAVKYIESLDKDNLESGTYEVNNFFYYIVQEYDTKPKSECVLESHRKYIDIQWIVEGIEAIDVADISRLQIDKTYSEDKDIMFWKLIPNMMRIVLKAGTYTVLYPENAHMGCIAMENAVRVKKIVCKVRVI